MDLLCDSCDLQSDRCGFCMAGHAVCSNCLTAQVTALLTDGYREVKFPCSAMGCSAPIAPDWYDNLVAANLMAQLASLEAAASSSSSSTSSSDSSHIEEEQATLSVTTQCPRCKARVLVQAGCRFIACRCGQRFCETCLAKLVQADKETHYCPGHNNTTVYTNDHGQALICEICLRCNLFPDPVDRIRVQPDSIFRPAPEILFDDLVGPAPIRWQVPGHIPVAIAEVDLMAHQLDNMVLVRPVRPAARRPRPRRRQPVVQPPVIAAPQPVQPAVPNVPIAPARRPRPVPAVAVKPPEPFRFNPAQLSRMRARLAVV